MKIAEKYVPPMWVIHFFFKSYNLHTSMKSQRKHYCLIGSSLKPMYSLFMTGIRDHRSAIELMYALEHIECLRSRMDTLGCPQEYTYEELRHLLVEESGYRFEDFERVLEEFRKTHGL